MHESPEQGQQGSKLATQSPWLLIAILLHVAVIAIASILYYGRQSANDDAAPTALAFATAPPPVVDLQPLDIVDRDRDRVPKLQDQDLEVGEHDFDPAASDEPDQSESNDANVTAELAGLPGDDGGGTPIGKGPGWYAPAPSAHGGPPGHGHHGGRFDKNLKKSDRSKDKTNEVVHLGLEWLRDHQDEDGHWDTANFMKHDRAGAPCTGSGNAVNDVGVTGLALLAFLGEGNTLKQGEFRKVVRAGIRWLLEQQDEQSGRIGAPSSQAFMYSHAIAALSVCEAYGLSEHRPLRAPAQAAINYIAQARNPYGVWRYQPRDGDGDSSITAWMVQALLSAKEFGLAVDAAALQSASAWFESVTDSTTGAVGYTKRGEGSSRPTDKVERFPAAKSEALTAAVLLCRHLMQQEPKNNPTMGRASERLLGKLPAWNEADGSIDMYYWYYGSYAMYQVGGRPWETWCKKMTAAAVDTQLREGNAKGSWNPVDPWGEEGGRVYSTAIMVLCLEAYYRYRRVLGGR